MAVEDEMAAGVGAVEAADDIGHLWMRRDDAVRQASPLEEAGNEPGGVARVARGIGATVLNESLQETHKIVTVPIDPIEQLLTPRVHLDLPLSILLLVPEPPSGHAFSSRRPAPTRQPDGSATQGLLLRPRSPMLPDSAISVILAKPQARRRVPAQDWELGLTRRGAPSRP